MLYCEDELKGEEERVFYIDGVKGIRNTVPGNGSETDFKWHRWAADLILVVVFPFNLGPASRLLVLNLGKLRPVVEEHERGPVLCAVGLKKMA